MLTERGVEQTPWNASPIPGSDATGLGTVGQITRFDNTVHTLMGEGTPIGKHSTMRIISSMPRVAVLALDGEPLMPSKASRVRKWIKNGKAVPIRTDLGLFAVVLLVEPHTRCVQDIVLGLDPGSSFTGIAVSSRRAILYGCNLELPTWVHDRVTKRRELRKNRRLRKCRRRKPRFSNRSKPKLVPTILSKKQFEIRIVKELAKTYPIQTIAIENVCFNHADKHFGKNFSLVEVGKVWQHMQLREISNLVMFYGWETSERRKIMGLKKNKHKNHRCANSHVTDAISLTSLVLGLVETKNPFPFNVLRRPAYSKRKLHLEKPSKGGIRRRYGGTTTPFEIRKGDYIEATWKGKKVRGYISGYSKKYVVISDFEWKRIGTYSIENIKLLKRNCGMTNTTIQILSGTTHHIPWRDSDG